MTTHTHIKKYSLALGLGLLLSCLGQNSARALNLPDVPLSIFSTVEHNVLLTFDDSGSMAWAYLPDTISGNSGTRRACSSTYNKVAYDPANTYVPPPVRTNPGNMKDTPADLPNASFTAAWINGFSTGSGTVNLSTSYRPVWQMNGTLTTNTVYATCTQAANIPAFYYVYDSTLGGCSPQTAATENNDNCYRLVQHNNAAAGGPWTAAQQTNFANWYSYYRTRNLAAKSAAGRAFRIVDTNVRVAGHLLNNTSATGGPSSGITFTNTTSTNTTNVLKRFCDDPASTDSLCRDGSTARTDFFTRLYNTPAANTTPLRLAMQRAGNSFGSGNTGAYSPYREVPGDPVSASNPELSCRKNFHIMMTDGYWRSTAGVSGNVDGTSHTLGDGTAYTPMPPYADAWSATLADNAFEYWYRDLRTDLDNNVEPKEYDPTGTLTQRYWNPANNPATWQHMQTFTIGLGIPGTLNNDTASNGPTYNGLKNGTINWPQPADNSINNIDDLWHAAINSRGKYFSARNPAELLNAFSDILATINSFNGSAASLGASGSSTSGGTSIFQVAYDTGNWAGRLISRSVDVNGETVSVNWEAGTTGLNTQNFASGPGGRNIITYNPTNPAGARGVPFLWASLSAAQQAALNKDYLNTTDTFGPDRLEYLRGASTYEGAPVTPSTPSFRTRTCYTPASAASVTPVAAPSCPANVGKLGDIIDSSPVYVGKPDFTYPDSIESVPYSTFVNDPLNSGSSSTRSPMVYVGANDGMLHGFGASDGKEKIAYVPNLVYSNITQNNLALLTSPIYSHRFYVNATPTVGDVFFNGAWHTMLVSGLGKGGRGYFALDVTDPTTFAESNASQIVKWEFTDPDLGFSYSKPTIAKMANGQWVAIFGNGYNNTNSGRAMIFIVDIATGALVQKIDTLNCNVTGQCGGGSVANPNGMSTPAVVDMNDDHIADYIYAGDLRGKMWRIDVRSNLPANWGLAANIHPLYTATDTAATPAPQPITTKPSVGFHPEGFGGLIIYFGTGKFLENFDNNSSGTQQRQTFYAIYDRGVTGRGIVEPSRREPNPITRADLLQQDITAGTPVFRPATANSPAVTFNTRNISDKPITWRLDRVSTAPATYLGWYVNLEEPGEKQVTNSLLREGRIIFTTLSPSADACEPEGTGWLMELSTKNGGRLDESLDLNGDNLFNSDDNPGNNFGVAGAQVAGGGSLSSPVVLTNPDGLPPPANSARYSETKLTVTSTGAIVSIKEAGKPNAPEAWRQLR